MYEKSWPGIGLLLASTQTITEQMKVIKYLQKRIEALEEILEDYS